MTVCHCVDLVHTCVLLFFLVMLWFAYPRAPSAKSLRVVSAFSGAVTPTHVDHCVLLGSFLTFRETPQLLAGRSGSFFMFVCLLVSQSCIASACTVLRFSLFVLRCMHLSTRGHAGSFVPPIVLLPTAHYWRVTVRKRARRLFATLRFLLSEEYFTDVCIYRDRAGSCSPFND